MIPIAMNPYFDEVLRRHVERVVRERGLNVADVEAVFDSELEVVEFLKECGIEYYEAYVEESSAAVDHIGWVVTPAPGIARKVPKS